MTTLFSLKSYLILTTTTSRIILQLLITLFSLKSYLVIRTNNKVRKQETTANLILLKVLPLTQHTNTNLPTSNNISLFSLKSYL